MKVAVVGSGVSGLAATWLLNEYSDHEVHLYESDFRPGGHANTVHYVPKGKTEGVDVDTGFIVMNPSTYPNFLRFLRLFPPKSSPHSWLRLPLPSFLRRSSPDLSSQTEGDTGIPIADTEMTFSVSRDGGVFEWAGKNLATVFCQPHRLVDPEMWRMVYDVLRFNVCARRVLVGAQREGEGKEMSIGVYLKREKYSLAFQNNYLIPMTAAIWSTPPGDCFLDFPARTLIQFMYNHNLLQITGKPSWMTILGGSHKYVNKILSNLPDTQLHLSSPVTSIKSLSSPGGSATKPQIILTTAQGDELTYDHVILACHSDTILKVLRNGGGVTEDEERILGAFGWSHNEVVLHSDEKLMPRSRLAWSCWNYLSFTKPVANGKVDEDSESDAGLYTKKEKSEDKVVQMEINRVSLTYGMNDLQHISEARYGPVLVTLNPPFEPDPEKTAGRWKYSHPVLNSAAVRAQNEMHKIQNTRSITYAGAWLKYGFHEDGFTSGLLAACALDEDRGSYPRAMPTSTPAAGMHMAIQTKKRSVRPPFEIRHADHHTRLERRGILSVYVVVGVLFDVFEMSGLRELVGLVGVVVLGVLARLLGIQKF